MIVKKILKKIRFIINLIIREIMYTAMRNKNFEYTFNKNLKHLAKVAGYPPPPSDIFERIYADKEQNQAEIWNGDDCFCCFIGHSSDEMKMSKKEIMPPLRKAVKEALNDGYSVFITGMSKGFERWAANIVIEEIKKDPCIDLECIIPDRNEALNYSIKEQIEYNRIIIYSICQDRYKNCGKKGLNTEEICMLNSSSRLITAYNGADGRVQNAVKYAEENKMKIVNILKA